MQESEMFNAITTGNESVVRKLLDCSVSCTVINEKGENYLHILSKQKFASLSPEDDSIRQRSRRNIIYMLCAEGLSPNQRDGEGKTPMHYAIQYSDPYLLKTFLQCAPNPPSDICVSILAGMCYAAQRRVLLLVQKTLGP